jgi:hypothetical protein
VVPTTDRSVFIGHLGCPTLLKIVYENIAATSVELPVAYVTLKPSSVAAEVPAMAI